MSRKLAVIFLFIVLGPAAAVLLLGYRLARDEQEMVEHRYRSVLEQRLADVDGQIAGYLETRRRELAEQMRGMDNAEALRRFVRSSPIARNGFIVDAGGRLLHPDPTGEMTQDERDFVMRTVNLWESGMMVYEAPPESMKRLAAQQQESSQQTQSLPQTSIQQTTTGQQAQTPRETWMRRRPGMTGWLPWYSSDGLSLLFWSIDEAGRVVGAELSRSRLIADIIGLLPATEASSSKQENALIVLSDSHGRDLYQWGSHRKKEKEKPQSKLSLSFPLSSWGLAYYGANGGEATGGLRGGTLFNILAGTAAFTLVLIALSVYFYREHNRQLRLAEQRVTFVNQVSHELKTPLTNIRMYAELLQERVEGGDERIRRALSVMVEESQRLSRLIANVLTFGRQQRNVVALHPTRGSIDEVVQSVLQSFAASFAERGIEVKYEARAGDQVVFDRDAVEQMLGNLLSNVEKYAACGKSLLVETALEGHAATITVTDRGPGIAAQHRERVFQPFFRINDSLTEGVSGTGIGLSITRELARRHGGDLELVSCDGGCVFRLTLKVERT